MTESARPTPESPATDAPSQADQTHTALRRRILELELPPGEAVSERGLETLVGASRTPVRAALARLEAEGLVRRSGRGWVVAPLDADEVDQLGVYREALEVAAVRLAAVRPDVDAVGELRRAVAAGSDGPRGVLDASRSFHVGLAALGGNRFLADGVRTALGRLERVRWLEVQDAADRARGVAEHLGILDAVAAADGDRAAELVAAHARHARERALELLAGERVRGLRVVPRAAPAAGSGTAPPR